MNVLVHRNEICSQLVWIYCLYRKTSIINVSSGATLRQHDEPSVYMGCSDVSEFEHIYGQISTTPSCVYDPLFTRTERWLLMRWSCERSWQHLFFFW